MNVSYQRLTAVNWKYHQPYNSLLYEELHNTTQMEENNLCVPNWFYSKGHKLCSSTQNSGGPFPHKRLGSTAGEGRTWFSLPTFLLATKESDLPGNTEKWIRYTFFDGQKTNLGSGAIGVNPRSPNFKGGKIFNIYT